MNKQLLLKQTRNFVKRKMQHEATGHDWFHLERVVKMAKYIAKGEKNKGTDVFIVQLAALLHDIGDWKIRDREKSEEEILENVMGELKFPDHVKDTVKDIVLKMSYSNNLDGKHSLSIDGGKKERELYNPLIRPKRFTSTHAYRTAHGTTVNHFYEKLFLLKDLLNTKIAKNIAQKRERFMKEFLDEFYKEWQGEK